MLGIPFGMAGSLIAAMMLSSSLKGTSRGDKDRLRWFVWP